MAITLRSYTGEADQPLMAQVVNASPAENLHVLDLAYRLSSWALDDPANIGVWVDAANQVIAWAIMQVPMWTIDYAYLPSIDSASIHD